jgi:hypothetical protein
VCELAEPRERTLRFSIHTALAGQEHRSSGCGDHGLGAAARPNKELKLTKPSILELRSLTPVLGTFSRIE